MPDYRPFGHSKYNENKARVRGDTTPCAWCGKAVHHPWVFAVRVIAVGAKFATQDAPDDGAAEMGCYPVGSVCAARLKSAGVPVFRW